MTQDRCPGGGVLQDYLLGRLPEDQAARIDRHLDVCENCLATLANCQSETDPLIVRLRATGLPESFCLERPCQEAVARVKALSGGQKPAAPAQPPAAPPIPAQLGEYQLLESLGGGGMGLVYRARHVKLNRVVAIKTLSPTRLGAGAQARFEREMRAIGQLEHPHIVHAYDARQIDGIPFLVMEYIEGVTLARLCREVGPHRTADACEIIRQAAEGLQYISDQGLVHRDIKPSNLMITFTGIVKILDLGLARFLMPDSQDEEMTAAGGVVGTASYIAPEQVSDSRLADIRADIYSLGRTLDRLLAGYAAPGEPHTVEQENFPAEGRQPDGRLCEGRPDLPAELRALLQRMLAERPEDRFAQPGEVAAAFGPFAMDAQLDALVAPFLGGAADRARHKLGLPPVPPAGHVGSRVETAVTQASRPRRRKATFWFLSVALACVLIALATTLAVVLRIQRGGGETVLHVPDASEVTVSGNGEVRIRVSDGSTAPPLTTDWERRVAEWALKTNARIHLFTRDGKLHKIDRAESLPREPFAIQLIMVWSTLQVQDQDLEMISRLRRITGLSLEGVPITDVGLRQLSEVTSLKWLTLSDTQVTANGLAPLRKLEGLEILGLNGLAITDDAIPQLCAWKHLHSLFLSRTRITDAGLVSLAGVGQLKTLDLHGTAVSDAGLEKLKQIATLENLDVRDTRVTPAGIESFRKAVPRCEVRSGKVEKSAQQ